MFLNICGKKIGEVTNKIREIKVTYTDGNVEGFPTIRETEEGILLTITGCDFATNVEKVEAIGEKGQFLFELICHWGLTLWQIRE